MILYALATLGALCLIGIGGTIALCVLIAHSEARRARLEQEKVARIQAAQAHNQERRSRVIGPELAQRLRADRPVLVDMSRPETWK